MTLEPFYIVSVIGVSENPACFYDAPLQRVVVWVSKSFWSCWYAA
jgi:hypothetical protein